MPEEENKTASGRADDGSMDEASRSSNSAGLAGEDQSKTTAEVSPPNEPKVVVDAHARAASIITEAEGKAKAIVDAANHQATAIVSDADRELVDLHVKIDAARTSLSGIEAAAEESKEKHVEAGKALESIKLNVAAIAEKVAAY